MIVDFLHQYRDELLESKFEIEQTIKELEISILEEKKFLEAIVTDSDSIFNEFSPRDLNAKNKAKEEEVIKKIATIQAELNTNNDNLKNIENKLSEISVLLTEVSSFSNTTIDNNKPVNQSVETEKSVIIEQLAGSLASAMIERLTEIKSLIYLDQAAAEKQIDILIDSLKINEI